MRPSTFPTSRLLSTSSAGPAGDSVQDLQRPQWLHHALKAQLLKAVAPDGHVTLVDVTTGAAGSSMLNDLVPHLPTANKAEVVSGNHFEDAVEAEAAQSEASDDDAHSTDRAAPALCVPTREALGIAGSDGRRVVVFSLPPWLDSSASRPAMERFKLADAAWQSARFMHDAVAALSPDAMLVVHPLSVLSRHGLWEPPAGAGAGAGSSADGSSSSSSDVEDEGSRKGGMLADMGARYKLQHAYVFPASAVAPAVQVRDMHAA